MASNVIRGLKLSYSQQVLLPTCNCHNLPIYTTFASLIWYFTSQLSLPAKYSNIQKYSTHIKLRFNKKLFMTRAAILFIVACLFPWVFVMHFLLGEKRCKTDVKFPLLKPDSDNKRMTFLDF